MENIKGFILLTISVIIGNLIGFFLSQFIFGNLATEKKDKSETQSTQQSTNLPKRIETPSDTICGYKVILSKDTLYVAYPLE